MDKRRRNKHRRNRKYSSDSSHSRPSSSVSISVSESSSSSEKVPRYRPKNHDNMVLLIENLPEDISKTMLDEKFNEAAIEANVIPHEEISIINAFGQAYIKYCTVDYARKVLIHLKGKIQIADKTLTVDFYDDTSGRQKRNRHELKNSLINQPPTSYDWICDKCGYENFAKRHKCNKCLNPRNINCKILSVMMAPPTGFSDDSVCNTSLMIKAKSIADATESDILDIFAPLASVKDIRLVKNKIPKDPRMKEQKDFAFVEFFTVEDAENVYRYVTQNEVRLHGDQLIIQYSRNNRVTRFDDHKPFQFVPTAQFPTNSVPTQQPSNKAPEIQERIINQQIVQPKVQAPYQTEQLAQERIISKSEPQENKTQLKMLPSLLSQYKLPVTSQLNQQNNNQLQSGPQNKRKEKEIQETQIEEEDDQEDFDLKQNTAPKKQAQLTEAQIRRREEQKLKKWEKQQQNNVSNKKINEVNKQQQIISNKLQQSEAGQRLYLCPICKRKFLSEDILTYHVLNSEMHKELLQKLNIQ